VLKKNREKKKILGGGGGGGGGVKSSVTILLCESFAKCSIGEVYCLISNSERDGIMPATKVTDNHFSGYHWIKYYKDLIILCLVNVCIT